LNSVNRATSFAKGIVGVSDSIRDIVSSGVMPAVQAVDDMVNSAKKLEAALAVGQTIDIDTKMKMFTSKFGKNLGSGGAYTVQSKDVNITINLRVAMDAKELEGIMVTRKDSIIRDRLDLLIDAVSDAEQTSKTAKGKLAGASITANSSPNTLGGYS
jgi:hypothetical protein